MISPTFPGQRHARISLLKLRRSNVEWHGIAEIGSGNAAVSSTAGGYPFQSSSPS